MRCWGLSQSGILTKFQNPDHEIWTNVGHDLDYTDRDYKIAIIDCDAFLITSCAFALF